tara:strand:- start:336 stop:446 length:111 start_codon:yes stop_codon:yes gene_type:complete
LGKGSEKHRTASSNVSYGVDRYVPKNERREKREASL